MTLSILQGRGHGRDGERRLSVESFPSSRESVFLSPKSNTPLVRGRFLQVESSAVLSLAHSLPDTWVTERTEDAASPSGSQEALPCPFPM